MKKPSTEHIFDLLEREDLRVNSHRNVLLLNDGDGKYGVYYYNGRFPHGMGRGGFSEIETRFCDLESGGALKIGDWKTIWRPDVIRNTYSLGHGLRVEEQVFTYKNSVIWTTKIRNEGPQKMRIAMVLKGTGMNHPDWSNREPVLYEDEQRTITSTLTENREYGTFQAGRIVISEREGLYEDTHCILGSEPGWDRAALASQEMEAPISSPDAASASIGNPVHYLAEKKLEIASGAESTLTRTMVFGEDAEATKRVCTSNLQDPEELLSNAHSELDAYFRKLPRMEGPENFRELFYYAYWQMMFDMYEFPGDLISIPYVCPGKSQHDGFWLWDSAFHAIIFRWLRGQKLAYDQLAGLEAMQLSNGAVPISVAPKGPTTYELPLRTGPGSPTFGCTLSKSLAEERLGTFSIISQPQLFAFGVWENYLISGDKALLEQYYEPMKRFGAWWQAERDAKGDGLVSIIHPYEAGRDNGKDQWGWVDGGIKSIDTVSYQYFHESQMAKIAEALDRKEEAERHRRLAEKIADSVNRTMWDEAMGFYVTVKADTYERIPVKTVAGLVPLFVGIATKERAARVVEHLTNPEEFWAAYPIPSLSLDDPDFAGAGFWNGPTWINHNWFVIQGLIRYGYDEVAARLAHRTLELPISGGKRPLINEIYDPQDGRPVGCWNYPWSCLFGDMVVRWIFGLEPRADEILEFNPLLLRTGQLDWEQASMEDISYRGRSIGIFWDKKEGYRVEVDGEMLFCSTHPVRIRVEEGEEFILRIEGRTAVEIPGRKGTVYRKSDHGWEQVMAEAGTIPEALIGEGGVFKIS